MEAKADFYLDITAEVCPMTFVHTKLAVERLSTGQTLEVRLKGKEPVTNVPKSVAELGHEIVALAPEPGEGGDGVHRLLIRKAG